MNKILSTLFLILSVLMSANLWAQEPYIVLDSGDKLTMTYYYDTNKSSHTSGYVVDFENRMSDNVYTNNRDYVEEIYIDSTFVHYPLTAANSLFSNFTALTAIYGLENLNTSNVENMYAMFAVCTKLTSIDVSGLNTANVKNMSSMFDGCTSLTTLDLSTFNTANVTNMMNMFYGCSSLTTIYVSSLWSTANVTSSSNGGALFKNCNNLVGGAGTAYDGEHYDIDYAHVDEGTTNPGYLTAKNVTTTVWSVIGTINGGWDTDTDMTSVDGVVYTASFPYMTAGNYEFKIRADHDWAVNYGEGGLQDGPNIAATVNEDLSTVTVSFNAETKAITYTVSAPVYGVVGGFNGWDDSVTGVMTKDENGIYSVTLNLEAESYEYKVRTNHEWTYYWGVGGDPNGENFSLTVTEAGPVTIYFNPATKYAGTEYPLSDDIELYAVLSEDDVMLSQSVTGVTYGQKLTFYYDGMQGQRPGAMSVTPFSLPQNRLWESMAANITTVEFDASVANDTTVTSTAYWFYGCQNLSVLTGLNYLNTQNVVDMQYMFHDCNALAAIDFSGFNTANVTNMSGMFYKCYSLKALDLGSFNTFKVTNMSWMFYSCYSLEKIKAGSYWTVANVTESEDMFMNCSELKGGLGTAYSDTYVDKTYARIDLGSETPGYLTDKDATTWSVIGTINGYWDTDTEMTSEDGVNYTATFININKEQDSYLFKIRANGSWDVNYGADGVQDGPNIEVSVTENLARIVVHFNAVTHEISYDVLSPIYSVIGARTDDSSAWLGWNDSDMTKDDHGIYCAIFENMSAGEYMFKVRANHDWDYQYGFEGRTDGGSEGSRFTVDTDGSTVNLYFNPATELVTMEYPLISDQEPYAVLTGDTISGMTLTFYYDDQKAAKNGMSVGPFDFGGTNRGWIDACAHITTVVFDESFKNDSTITSTAWWFRDFTNLTTIRDIEYLNTSNVTSMWGMFEMCTSLQSIDLSHFDTRKVEQTAYMFDGCSSLQSLDVSNFITANVKEMGAMFRNCSSLPSLDVTGFDTSKNLSLWGTFYGLTVSTLDISSFNTANTTDMGYMFANNANLTTIYVGNGWSTQSVAASEQTGSVGGLDMFANCTSLIGGLGTLYDANNVNEAYAHIDGGESNPGYLTDINGPLAYAVVEGDTLSGMTLTFYFDDQKNVRGGMTFSTFTENYENENSSFKIEGRPWEPYKRAIKTVVFDDSFAECKTITNTACWFYDCNNLTTISGMKNFNTSRVKSMWAMFLRCESLTSIDMEHFNTDNATVMGEMFFGCESLTDLDVSMFNTSNVYDMVSMFAGCSSLTNIDVKGFNTSRVIRMSNMFSGCSNLTSLDVSNFNTSNLRYYGLRQMFSGCSKLKELNLSSFNMNKVTDISFMFAEDSLLTTIYVADSWHTKAVELGDSVFYGCQALVGGMGTQYDPDKIDFTYARIDGGNSAPGYLTQFVVKGDANGDGNINIADAVATVTNILGQPTEAAFYMYAADMNTDQVIDIFDVTLIVNAAFDAASPAPAMTRGSADNIMMEHISMTADADYIYLGVDQPERFTATQFDVTLPEGMELVDARLASATTDHQLSFVKRGNNEYRVIGLSMSNTTFRSMNGQLIKLEVSGSAVDSDVKMSNVLFVTPTATVMTSIDKCLNTAKAADDSLYDLKGQRLSNQQLGKGIYIMNHKKVIIK